MALLETFQIEIPGVLKGHTGKTEGMRSNPLQENIPSAKTGAWFFLRRTTGASGKRPELLLKLSVPWRPRTLHFRPGSRCPWNFARSRVLVPHPASARNSHEMSSNRAPTQAAENAQFLSFRPSASRFRL